MLPQRRFSPEDIRRASASFSHAAASTYDGFHVRHFALLCDDALLALSEILVLMELTGGLPSQLRATILSMLGKPAGGFRPIGVFTSLYRL